MAAGGSGPACCKFGQNGELQWQVLEIEEPGWGAFTGKALVRLGGRQVRRHTRCPCREGWLEGGAVS